MKKFIAIFLFSYSPFTFANSEAPASTSLMAPDPSPIPIQMSYFGYASSQLSDNTESTASVYTFHMVSLHSKVSSQTSMGLSSAFTYESKGKRYGTEMPAETKMSDLSLDLIQKSTLFLPMEIKTKAVYRFLFPTDHLARLMGTQFGLTAKFEFDHDLTSKFNLGYIPKLTLLKQSQETYLDKPTKRAELEQWLNLTYYFGDQLSISQGLGLKDTFYSVATEEQSSHQQLQLLQTLMNLNLGDHMTLSMGLSQESENPTKRSLYNEAESAYLLMASVWM